MALFGEQYSRFKASDGTLVDLNYSTVIPEWNIVQVIENQSVFSRKTTYTRLSDDYAKFTVTVNLWKLADAAGKFNSIIKYNHDTVNFMLHIDANKYLQKVGGGDAQFYIKEITPYYISDEPPVNYTKVKILFQSLEPIDGYASIK